MNKRVNPQLWETGQGKYVADVGFTFAEVTQLRKAIDRLLKEVRRDKRDPDKSAKQHELSGYREGILKNTISYLYEAHHLLKDATNARKQGRYAANSKQNSSNLTNNGDIESDIENKSIDIGLQASQPIKPGGHDGK